MHRWVRPFGDRAVLVELPDAAAVRSYAAAAEAARAAGGSPWAAVTEVVPGFGSVLVAFDPDATTPDVAAAAASEVAATVLAAPAGAVPSGGRTVEVPVVFDGEDLAEAAELAGLTPRQAVAAVCAGPLNVDLVGFAPGFAYLTGLPAPLGAVPRRATPRPVVPAGSVALGGGYAGVYPTASPGGWHLLGHTAMTLFDPARPPFAVLRVGDQVWFRPAGEVSPAGGSVTARAPSTRTGAAGPGGSDAGARRAAWSDQPARRLLQPAPTVAGWVEVLEPGGLTTVQDAGRRGVAALGVPAAGSLDDDGRRLANRLVGNDDDAAVLEVTVSGPTLRFAADSWVAVLGAEVLRLDELAVPVASVVPVAAGQRLQVAALGASARAVVAVAGGIDIPPLLGSRSSDLLCGLGPGPVRRGDRLGIGRPGRPRGRLRPAAPREAGRPVVLRAVPGPDRFSPDDLRRLCDQSFAVSSHSDRIGTRLVPDSRPLSGTGPVPSKGMVRGALQVPGDGCPIVLQADHATVGGYPVVACVIDADLSLLARCRPGDRVRVELVDLPAAAAARRRAARERHQQVVGWFPLHAG